MILFIHRPAYHFLFVCAAAAIFICNAVPSPGLHEDHLTPTTRTSLRSHQHRKATGNSNNNNSSSNCNITHKKHSSAVYYTEPFQYFSKVKFLNSSLTKKYLPFEEYPLPANAMVAVKTMSYGDSPQTQADVPKYNATEEIRNLGGRPSFPKDGQIFWSELAQVTSMQILRRNGAPVPFTLPKLWENFTIGEVAEAVHSEYPGYWQGAVLQSFWKEKMKFDTNIFPFHSLNDFGLFIRCTAMNEWAINLICPVTFLVKWEVGRLRPEEAAFQVARRMFDDVPENLQQLIDSMDLQTPEEFTAYVEGSPLHPSWPAMHSSSSSISLWLAVVADLTEEQHCELLRMDYGVSMARTVAGIHYLTDNIAGLNLAQREIAAALPGYLYREYGADFDVVQAKIRSWRFDWNTYDNDKCTVQYDQERT